MCPVKATRIFLLSTFFLGASLPGAVAGGSPQHDLLEQELSGKVPSNWEVHVSQRADMLLAFLTPPYQEAFDLWYEPAKLHERMLGLCPGPNDKIWQYLALNETIAIEPTVGGKSADAMRLTCPRDNRPPA